MKGWWTAVVLLLCCGPGANSAFAGAEIRLLDQHLRQPAAARLQARLLFPLKNYRDIYLCSGDEAGRVYLRNLQPGTTYTWSNLPAGTYPVRAVLVRSNGSEVPGPVTEIVVHRTSFQVPVTLTIGRQGRQTFQGFGVSEVGGTDWSVLSSTQKAQIGQRVYRELDVRVLRLWFNFDYNNFVAKYIHNGLIKNALDHGVKELLFAPDRFPSSVSTVTAEGGRRLTDVAGYARLIAENIKRLKDEHGVIITVTGLINEPSGNTSQTKFVATADFPRLTKALRQELNSRGLQSVRIIGTENANCDGNSRTFLEAILADSEAKAALHGGSTHSYNMAANAAYAGIVANHGLTYWQTESGCLKGCGQNDFNHRMAAKATARFLNDLNFRVTHWIWFIGSQRLNPNDNQQRLLYWDANDLSRPDWLRANYQYYYLKQIMGSLPVGTRLRHVTSNLSNSSMTYTYGTKSPLNAAAGVRPDGKWFISVVNNTGDDFAVYDSLLRHSPQKEYRVTLDIPELSAVAEKRFRVFRSNQRIANAGLTEVVLRHGKVTLLLAPHELVTLSELP
jgi:hypothetical protein